MREGWQHGLIFCFVPFLLIYSRSLIKLAISFYAKTTWLKKKNFVNAFVDGLGQAKKPTCILYVESK